MSTHPDSAGNRYLRAVSQLISRLSTEEWPNLLAAATLVADSVGSGGTIHVFGSGHSHMMAEELFYRAGGLVKVSPILFDGLMLHSSAPLSTSLERIPGLAEALAQDHPIAQNDVLIVASNSGGNTVVAELATLVRDGGTPVIAVTSIAHATSAQARAKGHRRLHEIADVVLDNGGVVGDAAVDIAGFPRRVAPTSTVVGAAILNAVVAEAVEIMVGRGIIPDVFLSSNTSGGDVVNAPFLAREAAS